MDYEYVAIIQAGGKGTRMRELTHDQIPKPLLKLNNKPMMEWQILSLKRYGIKEFIFIIGHLGEMIEKYFEDGSKWNVRISYIRESEPLGSAGALYYAKKQIAHRNVIFAFGDVMFELDWERFIAFHEKKAGLVTLLAHPNSHPFDSDLLIIDEYDMVKGIDSKNNRRNYFYDNCVNAGISIFSYRLLERIDECRKIDYETELVEPLMSAGKVFAYNTPEFVKDVGTPERFKKACVEQQAGMWEMKCLTQKQKAIFLDRDGTINILNGFLSNTKQFELLPYVVEAIKKINSSEYLTIVATNQPVIARGECSVEELNRIHMKLQTKLGEKGAYVDDIFYCPHHPDSGYIREIKALKIKCKCRKPNIGMLEKAVDKYNLDLSKCCYIGDTTVDIQTGINAGTRTILLMTGEAGKDKKYDVVPTHYANTLLDAVNIILGNRDYEFSK